MNSYDEDWLNRMADQHARGEDPVWPFGDGPGFDPSTAHPDVSFVSMTSGDCLAGLRELAADSVDAVVTDPPYGMSIDGKAWDAEVPGVLVWRGVLRVCKPGAIVVAASHARTYHQLATILELAGFEILDMLHWRYNQAFPAGAKLDEDGWRTHLRRAHEPWCVARKPRAKGGSKRTYEEHGTGGLLVAGNGQDGASWAANSFHVSKPKAEERALGLDPAVKRQGVKRTGTRGKGSVVQANNHSTVKPLSLMRHLVSLVAKPGQVVLDPFAGSGTTGMACMAEGCNFVGFELEPESFDLFQQRVEWSHANPDQVPPKSR